MSDDNEQQPQRYAKEQSDVERRHVQASEPLRTILRPTEYYLPEMPVRPPEEPPPVKKDGK